jgi:hypothetical protein
LEHAPWDPSKSSLHSLREAHNTSGPFDQDGHQRSQEIPIKDKSNYVIHRNTSEECHKKRLEAEKLEIENRVKHGFSSRDAFRNYTQRRRESAMLAKGRFAMTTDTWGFGSNHSTAEHGYSFYGSTYNENHHHQRTMQDEGTSMMRDPSKR